MTAADPEVAAAAAIVAALEPLDRIARERVLDWAQNRYGMWDLLNQSYETAVKEAMRKIAALEAELEQLKAEPTMEATT